MQETEAEGGVLAAAANVIESLVLSHPSTCLCAPHHLPLPSVPRTSLGYGTLDGIFSSWCILLQRAEIRTDSLTKGHVKCVRQPREVLPGSCVGNW